MGMQWGHMLGAHDRKKNSEQDRQRRNIHCGCPLSPSVRTPGLWSWVARYSGKGLQSSVFHVLWFNRSRRHADASSQFCYRSW